MLASVATKVLILGIGLSKSAIEKLRIRTYPSMGPAGRLFCTACTSTCQEIKAYGRHKSVLRNRQMDGRSMKRGGSSMRALRRPTVLKIKFDTRLAHD
jgi:hypothetical protein